MLRNKRKLMMVAVLVLIVFTVAGCGTKATGGGWIDSVEGSCDKATFGFYAEALEDCGWGWEDATGNFCLKDHGTGQQFHGKVENMWFGCGFDYMAKFEGMTKPACGQPALPFTIKVKDSNESGKCDDGDEISIAIRGCQELVYYNEGELQGGNINVD